MTRSSFVHALLSTAIIFSAAPLSAQDTGKKWEPWIDAEFDVGNDRSIGQLDAFAPVLQDSTSLLFINPRIRLDDQNSQEYNIGAGYRTLWNNEWVLGGYAYVDRSHSTNDNDFNQATFGLEALGTNWKLRANDYEPFGKRRYGGVTPTVVNNGGNLQIVSNSERSLRGNDAEIGYRLPLYDVSSLKQLWVYGGGYHFDASGAENVTGPRGRVEYELGDIALVDRDLRLRLSGEISHDSVRDTQAFVGIRVGIPLGATGRDTTRKLSPVERHMIDPVKRDVDIVLSSSGSTAEDALNSAGQNIGTIDTVVAGDNVAAKVAAAGANSLVIFDGVGGTITAAAQVNMANGQTLLGAGTSLTLYGATTGTAASYVPSGTAPVVTGSIAGGGSNAAVINLAPSAVVSGLTVNNTNVANFSHAIFGNATDHVIVMGNTLTSAGSASSGVLLSNAPDSLITNNTSSTTGFGGNSIEVGLSDRTVISGNTASVNRAMAIFVNNSDTITISGNHVTAPNDSGGISVNTVNDVAISNNTILATGNTSSALILGFADNIAVNGNALTANGNFGVYLDSATDLSGSGNTFSTTAATPFCHENVGGNTGSIDFGSSGVCP